MIDVNIDKITAQTYSNVVEILQENQGVARPMCI